MPDVILTQAEFDALKSLHKAALELVTGIPYVTMAGGNITRQNILVQALSAALEKTRDVDFENARAYSRSNPYISDEDKARIGELQALMENPSLPQSLSLTGAMIPKDKPRATSNRRRTKPASR